MVFIYEEFMRKGRREAGSVRENCTNIAKYLPSFAPTE